MGISVKAKPKVKKKKKEKTVVDKYVEAPDRTMKGSAGFKYKYQKSKIPSTTGNKFERFPAKISPRKKGETLKQWKARAWKKGKRIKKVDEKRFKLYASKKMT